MPTADDNSLGVRLRRLRYERKLSREGLAERAGISPEMVASTEQGRRHPRWDVMQRLADALDVPVSELADRRPRLGGDRDASVLALRDAIVSPVELGLAPETGEPADPAAVRAAADRAARDYWDGELAALAADLPRLIAAARATRREHGPSAATPLVLAYDRAAGLLVHLGREDLAAAAAERAIAAAAAGDDGQLLATMHGTYAWVLLHQGRLAEAERIAAEAARALQPGPRPSDRDLGVYGNALMTAVGPAGAAGSDVSAYIAEAREAARRMAGPVRLWATTFSASSVAMQACYAHAVRRDPGPALAAAREVDPAELPGVISRARHLLDVAQAQADARRPQAAVEAMAAAQEMAPAWFAHQGAARVLVDELLGARLRAGKGTPLARLAAAVHPGGHAAYYRVLLLPALRERRDFPGDSYPPYLSLSDIWR